MGHGGLAKIVAGSPHAYGTRSASAKPDRRSKLTAGLSVALHSRRYPWPGAKSSKWDSSRRPMPRPQLDGWTISPRTQGERSRCSGMSNSPKTDRTGSCARVINRNPGHRQAIAVGLAR